MKTRPRFHLCGVAALLMDVSQGPFDLVAQQRLWTLHGADGGLKRISSVRSALLGVNNMIVKFEPQETDLEKLKESLLQAWELALPSESEGHLVEIPVEYTCSGDSDLEELACQANLDVATVIQLHTSAEYRVACVGWVPGFAFLVGLPAQLVRPRRATPRLKVPRGSVGIGGVQTGVIPLEVPSGWNLIGHTSVQLFDPSRSNPCLWAPGDRVRFVAQGAA